jgi:hypothetical protein
MSKIARNRQPFINETLRYDTLRAANTYMRLGGAALGAMANREAIEAEDQFDEKAISEFDPDKVYGYHLFTVEGNRLTLSSEADDAVDDQGHHLPHTILAAAISEDGKSIELQKFRQDGHSLDELAVFDDDWHILDLAVEELHRINGLLEADVS